MSHPHSAGSHSRSHIPAVSRNRLREESIAQSDLTDEDGFLQLFYLRRGGTSKMKAFVEFIGTGGDGRPAVVSGTPDKELQTWIGEVMSRIKTQIDAAFASAGAAGTADATIAQISTEAYGTLYTVEREHSHGGGRVFFVSMQVENHWATPDDQESDWCAFTDFNTVKWKGESLWGDIPAKYVQLER